MIAQLGNLLRRTISDAGTQIVPLGCEMETDRFEDELRVDVRVSPELRRGTGISNTAARLLRLCGAHHSVGRPERLPHKSCLSTRRSTNLAVRALTLAFILATCAAAADQDWPTYGGDAGG